MSSKMIRFPRRSPFGLRRAKDTPKTVVLTLLSASAFVFLVYDSRLSSTPKNAEGMPAEVRTVCITEQPESVKGKRNRRFRGPESIIILIGNYRDSRRCSETLKSLFSNAVNPDNLKVAIYDQIYLQQGEERCVDVFCNLVGKSNCFRDQIVNKTADAANATGPTRARYEIEKFIGDEQFCLSVDSHVTFVDRWDQKLLLDWFALANKKAILTVYPKSAPSLVDGASDQVPYMRNAKIESADADAMVQYGSAVSIARMPKPRIMSQFAAGFNFGSCEHAKEARSDPYTPFLFHGEEYSRAARLWTRGYDFYAPTQDIVFHWYETRKVVWETDWEKRSLIQKKSRRRIRCMMGLNVSSRDFDEFGLKKFGLGKRRTFAQWQNFTKIDPGDSFDASKDPQFSNCGELSLVPYK
ncbi:skp1-protein-hydroxyproline N-acetylglucosaminyltransferase-like [Paramacrobiotus metropolitanus]|uniref:skp1-protein-hydroxyproline N-acetylglucosaminyltransferase-like n=1 Tax=Paramacrobiotus metropolitanus TaxID=2943436 RepID=UPI002445B156|nr:skp1-protein-hydroxyproline N-acetylglucosaminyltransferase-like [Paramacrobiotus metropolitanus]XP_055356724.1 skp1-protein-hydroxyproline N-acetylglucosaminyltransferase-like [Paramacrobiotus metropolitanus]XP_055356725.1 skp1-protein-hydroxyproline N-acetylglucosaminyltransferase-like [Paramacrobiotus metropolitanus]XP_055356726.1 skp1-protein-hydroxyproline N-acetylglucosaminyltransferase-like [Paramacrobiotus metropolitanus]